MANSKPLIKSTTAWSSTASTAALIAMILNSSGLPVSEAMIAEAWPLLGAISLWGLNLWGRIKAKTKVTIF